MTVTDAYVRVMCDECEDEEIEVGLTSIARNGWDERDVAGAVQDRGWEVDGTKHVGPNCIEERDAKKIAKQKRGSVK
jgi:hypothetical protein